MRTYQKLMMLVEPPVAAATLVNGADESAHAPEQEDESDKIGEYGFCKHYAAHKHESDEHVDDASGKPPSPSDTAAIFYLF